ncbi:GntR family transcriptional regulator [Sporomusa termitida]|uniref:HTH-type transcriptional repressor YvoA n=1 Tax=Sporomusa termitida TaxID=2377 RepID=A0A517DQZ6_9FIRM|nr:GntR family transcriptional regulator [Sporomusa termitida]QDR79789.1 HTH-type transcriptional repressor YvoA [Sporomusa termitida]
MRLNGDKGIPLYYQLKKIIRDKIEAGIWSAGEQIPNEMQLVDVYQVSRATVRQAVLDLVREGILIRKKGVGTFVSRPKLAGDLTINFYYPEEFGTKHVPLSSHIIDPPAWVAKQLQTGPGMKVYEIIRLRLFTEEPAAVETLYLPIEVFPDLLQANLAERIYDLLAAHFGITISKFISYVEPVLLNAYEASWLQASQNQPALKIIKIGLNQQDSPFVVTESVFRGDRYKLSFNHAE